MEYRSVRARQDRWLSAALRIVAREDPSWGYRLAGGYLRLRGWQLNDKRVFRLWRLNGLSLPPYRPRRKIRSGDKLEGPARHRNDVWAWDFVHDRYGDAEPLRCLTVKDEATGYCLAIKTGRHLQHQHVKAALREMITRFGTPESDPQRQRQRTARRGVAGADEKATASSWRTSNRESRGRMAAMKVSMAPFAKNV